MNLAQIYYFTQVLQYGSIKKAAEKLNIKRTTLLMSLNALEEELGQPLLIRQKEGTVIAPESVDLIDIFQEMQDKLEQIEDLRKKWHTEQQLQIYSDSVILISLIEQLNANYRSARKTEQLSIKINKVPATEADFVFTTNPSAYDANQHQVYSLCESPYQICSFHTHPLAQNASIDLTSREIPYPIFLLSDAPLPDYPYQSINNLPSLRHIISTSSCLALIPEIILQYTTAPFDKLLVPFHTKGCDLNLHVFLLANINIVQHTACHDYLQYILSTFKE